MDRFSDFKKRNIRKDHDILNNCILAIRMYNLDSCNPITFVVLKVVEPKLGYRSVMARPTEYENATATYIRRVQYPYTYTLSINTLHDSKYGIVW